MDLPHVCHCFTSFFKEQLTSRPFLQSKDFFLCVLLLRLEFRLSNTMTLSVTQEYKSRYMCVYVLSPWHWLSWIRKPCGHVGTQRPSYRLDGEGQDVQLSADGPAHCQQEGWHSEEDTKSSDMVTMKKRSIKEKERRRLNPQLCLLHYSTATTEKWKDEWMALLF